MENKAFLEGYDIDRAKGCVSNIEDKMKAIKMELETREHPYKYYLLEKLNPILNDINCLISMCERDD